MAILGLGWVFNARCFKYAVMLGVLRLAKARYSVRLGVLRLGIQ